MKPHKHAELIKAWADGETIEMFSADGCWMEVPHPSWRSDMEYRIRHEPKPDTVEERLLFWNMAIPADAALRETGWSRWLKNGDSYRFLAKFKLTFDGETGFLKDAELIK
jgi:hypothetical protein